MRLFLSLVVVAALAAPASAIVVDGALDGAYGAPLAIQTVETQFGDSTGGLTGGGELDAGYARIEGGRLFVMLTGNIENNFNKVNVFIDSVAGGENVLSALPLYDGGVSANFGGLTFDAGFEADYHVFGRWGGFSGNVFEVDFVDRQGGAACGGGTCVGNAGVATVGGGTAVQQGSVLVGAAGNGTDGNALTQSLDFGFDNTNSAGVLGGTAAADQVAAAAVTTGWEFSVALADIGNPSIGDVIKIHAAYGNGDNNFNSNQILGGLPTGLMNGVGAGTGTGNLGGDGNGIFTGDLSGIDYNNYAGDQFFSITVVPEPGSALLALLAAPVALRRRRG